MTTATDPTPPAPPTAVRVLVVDDCAMVRTGLSILLGLEPDIEVLDAAADGTEAVELAIELCPDVVVMDVVMPGCDGVRATARIRDACPKTRVLLLSFNDDPHTIEAGIAAGAAGYLLKDAGADAIVAAVRAVHRGLRLDAAEAVRDVATTS